VTPGVALEPPEALHRVTTIGVTIIFEPLYGVDHVHVSIVPGDVSSQTSAPVRPLGLPTTPTSEAAEILPPS